MFSFGCGKKDTETAPSAGASNDALGKVDVPDDANSKAFAGKILANQVTGYSPADGYGMKFVYKTLTFRNDNSWSADAILGEGEDSVACIERGTWTMDVATDEHTADMSWKLEDTTCPGRQSQNMMRVNVHIEKGVYSLQNR